MAEIKKKTYESPSVKVYEIEPIQVLAGSNGTTTVNDWDDGGFLGTIMMEEWDLEDIK